MQTLESRRGIGNVDELAARIAKAVKQSIVKMHRERGWSTPLYWSVQVVADGETLGLCVNPSGLCVSNRSNEMREYIERVLVEGYNLVMLLEARKEVKRLMELIKDGCKNGMTLHDFEREREAWLVEYEGDKVTFTRLICVDIGVREYEIFIDSFTVCMCCGAATLNECKAVMLDVVRLEKLLVNAVSVEELKQMYFPEVVCNVLKEEGVITDE